MFAAARMGDQPSHDGLTPAGVVALPLAGLCPAGLVIIEGLPAAHVGCTVVCSGAIMVGTVHPPQPIPPAPPPTLVMGSASVMIHSMPATRWVPSGDLTSCGAFVGTFPMLGTRRVFIGGPSLFIPSPPFSSLFTQEMGMSCVIASSRNMIKRLTGKDIPEEQLREEMKEIMGDPDHDFEKDGINPIHAQELLEKHGVDTSSEKGVKSEDLGELTKGGKPVLIGFKNPGHRVSLDGVGTDENGNKVYYVSDPDPAYNGEPRVMSQEEFDEKYNDKAIVIVPD